MRHCFAALVLALLAITTVHAATISGYVRDSETKESLVSATVSIAGTRLGARTNKSGFFSIQNVPAGRQTVVASYLGYDRYELAIELTTDEARRMNIELKPGSVKTGEITVRAERETETREIEISRVDVPIEQLSEIRLGGESDVFRALQYLPGVLASSQISSGLYVRGGSPDQNLVLVDGAVVYNPSHLFGFYSAFNTDAIKDVELIKGGFPAEYGGRLSAVLNITQKEGNREKVEGLASIGLIASRLALEGPVGNGSWFIGGRRTYLDLILEIAPETEDPIPDFYFYDANARITQEIGDNDRISLSGFISRDHLTFAGTGLDFGMDLGNTTGAVKWTHIAGSNLFTTFTAAASEYSTGFTGGFSGTGFGVTNTITDYTARLGAEWYASDLATVRMGVEATNYQFQYLQEFFGPADSAGTGATPAIPQADLIIPDWVYGGYAQLTYQLTDELGLQGGVRADYFDLNNSTTIDPRVALRYTASPALSFKA
ncbi:MAG: TonB-dependent receptor, partial [bacterium]|nr:TonB-dependent receptor [Candidatus Kapabacteria bacterium]